MKLPKITDRWLVKHNACVQGYVHFSAFAGNYHSPIILVHQLVLANKQKWANWLIVRVMSRKQRTAYAIYAAELGLAAIGTVDKKLTIRAAIKAAKSNKGLKKNHAIAAAAFAACVSAYSKDASAFAASDAAAYAADACAALSASPTKSRREAYNKILEYGIKLLKGEIK